MISSHQNNSFIRSPLNQLETQIARARSYKSVGHSLNNSVPTRSNSVPSRLISAPTRSTNRIPLRSKLRTMDPRDPRELGYGTGNSYGNNSYDPDDNESLYSFESVSTNGRLLDRLEFDHDDYRRDSIVSIQSTGRLLDKLDVNRTSSVNSKKSMSKNHSPSSTHNLPSTQVPTRSNSRTPSTRSKSKPISAIPSANLNRYPSSNLNISSRRIPSYKKHTEQPQKEDVKVNVKSVTQNIVFHNVTASVDSFTADIASIGSASSASISNMPYDTYQSQDQFNFISDDSFDSKTSDATSLERSGEEKDSFDSVTQSVGRSRDRLQNGPSNPDRPLPDKPHPEIPQSRPHATRNHSRVHSENSILPMEISRTPSTPNLRSKERIPLNKTSSTSSVTRNTSSSGRIASDSSVGSSTGRSIYPTPSNSPLGSDGLTPETRTNLAQQLRTMGNNREASYQLQISANPPNNYPRAMYLYSMALRFGNGVKQNDRHAVKWLCKCVITYPTYSHSSDHLSKMVERLNVLSPDDLIKLILNQLKSTVQDDALHNGEDPFFVYEKFRALSKPQISKMSTATKNQTDILAQAYHELGQTLINGWGLTSKDEENGIKLLSKAGALGNTSSMIELGEIWNTKTKYHKKDHSKAAAWLRSSEIFGVSSIGNSWIYKDKYMQPIKKSSKTLQGE